MNTFTTQLLDPAWEEHGGGGRGCQNHYETMPVAQMPRAIMASPMWRPSRSAHCWIWATRTYLKDALWLMGRLGFLYKTELIWYKTDTEGKPRLSLGQYARSVHESLLLGTRGGALMPETKVASVFTAPVPSKAGKRIHSRKPPRAYEIIETVSPGPYVEFFGRVDRPGWTSVGLDADGQLFTAQESLSL
jgi:N6-adenosine-specific RNA methylase IME4